MNKGFFWYVEIVIGFIFLLLMVVSYYNYVGKDYSYYFALQKANDVLRVNSYYREIMPQDILDEFFDNFGYKYCVNNICYSNKITYKNYLSKNAEIYIKGILKNVSITVFYN